MNVMNFSRMSFVCLNLLKIWLDVLDVLKMSLDVLDVLKMPFVRYEYLYTVLVSIIAKRMKTDYKL